MGPGVSRRTNANYRGEDEAGDISSGVLIEIEVGSATAQRY
ncbi:hypothetical protein [Halalkalicoccus tibetensis]|uniref:Uncharacterized protein n=1 Tax=Halalkalicoccus tibetensis TaxID=175632 RepID=A0ABD5V2Q6_9EURY